MSNESIWEIDTQISKRSKLNTDIECDILIIGAGLAGTLIGYFLSKENKDVVIIDKDRIGNGTSKNTTGKITAQHNLIYSKLLKTIGYDKTKLFYQANIDALNKYKEIINNNNISCDFQISDSYVYTLRNTNKLKKEYKAYKKLEIDGELVNETTLPFTIKEALKMKNQASFNCYKFISYISNNLKIYEDTKMIKIEDNIVLTESNNKIKFNKLIIASHFPLIDIYGYYFLKQHQSKSYLLALQNTKNVNGMYIDENNKNGYTLRDYKDYVIFGGYNHKTGKNNDKYYFDKLENESKKYFPGSSVITTFSAQDCMSLDNLPYIGKYSKLKYNIYVATGFNKWGMTGSMLSAMILTDLINGKDNKYAKLFNPSRLNVLASISSIVSNSINSINGLFLKRLLINRKEIKELKNDDSIIIKHKKRYLGIYKDTKGKLHAVDVRCPHLGCILSFNKEERAYECPCHGSKFDYKGDLIYSPSVHNLKKYEL